MFVPFNFTKDSYIADVVSALLVYHGFYLPSNPKLSGAVLDETYPQFLIAKEVKDAGGTTTSMKWASASYDKAWTGHAGWTYI
jgi:hypothetical protein